MNRVIMVLGMVCILMVSAQGAGAPDIRVQQDRGSSTTVEFVLNGYKIEPVVIDGKQCVRVTVPGNVVTHLEKGLPELPKFAGSVIIPDEGEMSINIIDADYEVFKVDPVVPSKGNLKRNIDPSAVPYTWGDFYTRDVWFPEQTIELSAPFIMRDFRGQTIRFNAFQYNPARNELRVLKRAVVEVNRIGAGGENILVRKDNYISKDFYPIYEDFFLNYDNVRGRYPFLSEAVGNMLIITADAYYDNLAPFVYWKRKKGIPVEICSVSVIGNNSTSIKNKIQTKYNSGGVTWVLLVGEANLVATISGSYDETCDPVYSYLAGGDTYLDAFICRFSASTDAQVDNQVTRSVEYERYPPQGTGWAWYRKGIVTATSEGTPQDSTRANWVRDTMMSYTYTTVTKVYEPWGTDAMITTAVNTGLSLFNHIGHGDETGFGTQTAFWFDVTDIGNLTNTDMLPFVYLVACLCGDFDAVATCCAEAWMWDGTAASPQGAIAVYGASVLQSWVPPTVAQIHSMSLLKHETAVTIGGMAYNGSMHMVEQTGDLEMQETWHIFGDASLDLRTRVPDTLLVTHNSFIPPSNTNFTVNVKDNNGTTPIPNALVCLWIYTQTPQLHVKGYTDASGNITFNVTPQDPADTMWVTVTKHNYSPYQGYAIVNAPSGPYILLSSTVLNEPSGNGQANPGETIGLGVWAKNVGTVQAQQVYGLMSEADPYVILTVDSSWYGNIAVNDSALSSPYYQFNITNNCPNGHVVNFDLQFVDLYDSTWMSHPSVMVYAPLLTYQSVSVVGGNGNGILDVGETANLVVTVKNDGGAVATSVTSTLMESSTYITISDASGNFGTINVGATANNAADPYTVTASGSTPTGTVVDFQVRVVSGVYVDTLDFSLVVGKKHYYIWNPDPTPTPGSNCHTILGNLGYSGDYGTTLAADLTLYSAVLVFVGVYSNNYVIASGSAEAAALVDFLQNQGGRMYLEGGDVWYYDPLYQGGYNFGTLFGINATADGSGDMGPITGQSGTFTSGMSFTYGGENSWMDHISATGTGAFLIFTDNAPYDCGVANAQATYKTVGNSFELGLLTDGSGVSTRAALLDSIMKFFGIVIVGAEEEAGLTALGAKFGLQVYPTVFQNQMILKYSLGSGAKSGVLKIYDASGRAVRSFTLSSSSATPYGGSALSVFWNGTDDAGRLVPAGVYFVKLEAGGQTQVQKAVLLR